VELEKTPVDIPEVPLSSVVPLDAQEPLNCCPPLGGTRSVAMAPWAVAPRLLQSLPSGAMGAWTSRESCGGVLPSPAGKSDH
jgi:hypothetical protein